MCCENVVWASVLGPTTHTSPWACTGYHHHYRLPTRPPLFATSLPVPPHALGEGLFRLRGRQDPAAVRAALKCSKKVGAHALPAPTAAGATLPWRASPNTDSSTASKTPDDRSRASTARRYTRVWVPSRCTSAHTLCPASVNCVARPSHVHGCSRDTLGRTRERSPSSALSATAALLIVAICGPIFRPTQMSRSTHAERVPKRSPARLCW